MELKDIPIALLLVTAVVVGFTLFLGQTAEQYDVQLADGNWNNSFDVVPNITQDTSDIQGSALSEVPVVGQVLDAFQNVASAARIVGRSIGLFFTMTGMFFDEILQGHEYIGIIVITIITLIIIFLIIQFLWRYKG